MVLFACLHTLLHNPGDSTVCPDIRGSHALRDCCREDWAANCKLLAMIRRGRYPSNAGQSQHIAWSPQTENWRAWLPNLCRQKTYWWESQQIAQSLQTESWQISQTENLLLGATISLPGKHITVPVRLPKPLEIKASLDFPVAVCSLATCGTETSSPESWSQGYRHSPEDHQVCLRRCGGPSNLS